MSSSGGGDGSEKGSTIWSLLPSFDPAKDDIREYTQKVKFLWNMCPARDKGMLAPRLAMQCSGTAWGQVRAIRSEELTDPELGVPALLKALSAWEELSEIKTYELFERAVFKTQQKVDETTQSFVNRLEVAFQEVGEISMKEMKAFLLLRQSSLTSEDKRRVISMTGGEFETTKIEGAMCAMSTRILGSNADGKKKVYPVHYSEEEVIQEQQGESETYAAGFLDEEELDDETIESYAYQGDSDALTVQTFERDLSEMLQEVPDLQPALISYMEARSNLLDKKKSRGFWPASGRGFTSSKGKGKGFGKGKSAGGKSSLLQRIARTHCKKCGQLGHWKAECPLNGGSASSGPKEQANTVITMETLAETEETDSEAHFVVVPDDDEARGDRPPMRCMK